MPLPNPDTTPPVTKMYFGISVYLTVYSTVTLFARFLGLSTSKPRLTLV